MLWPFDIVPRVMVIPTLKLFHCCSNCSFATVTNHNINTWYAECLICFPCGNCNSQVEKHCNRFFILMAMSENWRSSATTNSTVLNMIFWYLRHRGQEIAMEFNSSVAQITFYLLWPGSVLWTHCRCTRAWKEAIGQFLKLVTWCDSVLRESSVW